MAKAADCPLEPVLVWSYGNRDTGGPLKRGPAPQRPTIQLVQIATRGSKKVDERRRTDAAKLLTRIRRQWFNKRKSIAALLREVLYNQPSALLDSDAENRLAEELRHPGPSRIQFVADAFRAGWSLERVHDLTAIDPWFLVQIEDLVREERRVRDEGFAALGRDRLWALKRKGFADARLARLPVVIISSFRVT